MPVGISCHLGLSKIDPAHYAGNSGSLQGPKHDVRSMNDIAEFNNFHILTHPILQSENIKRSTIENLFTTASKSLKEGDFFFFSYSGHGGLLPNLNNTKYDEEKFDQTYCLYDGQFVDDEIKKLLSLFAPGVRVLIISDSCYSGSIIKQNTFQFKLPRIKFLGNEALNKTYLKNKDQYDKILKNTYIESSKITASIIMISSSSDQEVSYDGPYNSVFTEHLLDVWNEGNFKGSYIDFIKQITLKCTPKQTPQILYLGKSLPSFYNSIPFQI